MEIKRNWPLGCLRLSLPCPSHPSTGSLQMDPCHYLAEGGVALGGAVTVWCECRCQGARVLLSKAGDLAAQHATDPTGDVVEFPICNLSQGDAGNYSCRYSTKWDPPVLSEPSDPVNLVVAGREFLKPTISVSPSRVVALGGNVTIRCEGLYPGMEFFLRKAGHLNLQVRLVPDGTVAEFPIASVSREDGGSYTCDYRSITEQNRTSHPSDPVEIIVGEPSYPKPNISLRPGGGVSLGGAVTVWCRGQRRGVRFVLNKEGRHFPPVDSDGFEVVFPISNMSREHGGSYSCSYHSRSEPFAVSYPSNPVKVLVRAGREFPKPTIWVSPSRVVALGGSVTIRCEGWYLGMEFFLRKAGPGHPNLQVQTVPDGTVAEFPIASVSREDGGSYTCDYRPITEQNRSSQLSDPVEIIVAGEGRALLSGPAPSPTPSQTHRGSLHRWDAQSQALP
uniref:Ig-like domain-containing protein n=1 Tax=Terrapene triunguis TaxID=2587831 RepID=A0A674K2E7_9SAUR